MKTKPLIIAATAAVAVALAGVSANALAGPTESSIDPDLLQQRADELSEALDVAVVAEVRDGDETWSGAAGTREAGGDEAAEPDDHVRVGSITKSMVTTVLLQLAEDGEVDLDADVNDVLPGTLPYEDTITVRQLLNHTSGIPDYFAEVYPSLKEGSFADIETNRDLEFTPEELIEAATSNPLDFEPGSDYSYSNTGYFIIGSIIEEVTGESVEDEVTDRVLEPVGMDGSYLPDTDPGMEDPFLRQYFPTGEGDERWDTTEISPTQLWAAGVTVSRPGDINAFYRALLDGDLLEDDSLQQMRDYTEQSEGSYGLGLTAVSVGDQCEPVPDGIVEGHTGGTLGHNSFSFSSPDGQRQMTYTIGVDPQSLPDDQAQRFNDLSVNLQYAGLCDGEELPSDFDADSMRQQSRLM